MSPVSAKGAQGRSNRRRGNSTELLVAGYLKARGFDAATTRSVLGHGGTQQPGDVVGLPGWSIECKAVKSSAWPSWCAQAEAQAQGLAWVVVRRLDGCGDVGQWPCVLPLHVWPVDSRLIRSTSVGIGHVVAQMLAGVDLPYFSPATIFRPGIVACRFGALVDAIEAQS